MRYYIAKSPEGRAIIFYSKIDATNSGMEFSEFTDIPSGDGVLMTDLSSLWWEPTPEPEPIPGPEPEPKDPYAEMAQAIREGVNLV